MASWEIPTVESILTKDDDDMLGWKCAEKDDSHCILEGVRANLGMAKKVTIGKKSTIFVLSSWNLVKVTTSRASYFDQFSWA